MPTSTTEKIANTIGEVGYGMMAGGPITKGVQNLAPSAPEGFTALKGTEADKILQKNKIPLTKGQAKGTMERLRSAVRDNPFAVLRP